MGTTTKRQMTVEEAFRKVKPFQSFDKGWKDSYFKKLRMQLQHEKKAAAYHAHTCLTGREEYGYSMEVLHVKAVLSHLREMQNKTDVMYSVLDTLGENTKKHLENALGHLMGYIGTSRDPLTIEDVVSVCTDYMEYVLSFRRGERA